MNQSKNLFLLAIPIILLFSSCNNLDKDTFYKINIQRSFGTGNVKLMVYEFSKDNDVVDTKTLLGYANNGKTASYVANPRTVKIKIKLVYDALLDKDKYRWVQKVFFLDKGKSNTIIIDQSCAIAEREP